MAGTALDPVGFYPIGFGSIVEINDPPDPPNGARFLDYLTGDYVGEFVLTVEEPAPGTELVVDVPTTFSGTCSEASNVILTWHSDGGTDGIGTVSKPTPTTWTCEVTPPAARVGETQVDVRNSDGDFARMPSTRQRVWLALGTVKGSSTIAPDEGVKLPGKVGPNYETECQQAVRSALKPLIDDGSIRLNSVQVEHGTPIGRSKITVDYTDTATGQAFRVTR
jgi:hypothetical protein